MNEFLKQLREWVAAVVEARDAALTKRDEITNKAKAETRDLTVDETKSLDAADAEFRRLAEEARECHERIAEVELQVAAETKAGQVAQALGLPVVDVKSEPLTYERHNAKERSYFADLGRALIGNDSEAMARLQAHGREMDVEMPRRERERAVRAERDMSGLGYESPFEQRVNPNRTDGQGGYFVPPLWLVDEHIKALRAGRVFADQCRQLDLPAGTDSVNIPKVATGTATAIQTADGQAVQSTDLTDTSVSAGVKTIAGQQDVALQLLEQSPVAFDEVVLDDLIRDYNQKLDVQCLAGTDASGQMKGIYPYTNWTSTNTAYTDNDPTVPELWAPLAQALSAVAQNRFDLSSTKIFMHPRRWFWIVGALDSTRPLVLPAQFGGFNQLGSAVGPVAEGYVGQMTLGAPVFIDANVPTTDSSTRDVIVVGNTNDAMLFEGALRTRVLPEALSGTLQVRFQVYNYCAFLVRYGKAFTVISGTGLAAPSGY